MLLTIASKETFFQVNFFQLDLSRDFIQSEAIDKSQQNEISFSDNDDDEITQQDKEFIDDTEQPMEDVSFYRTFDPENIDQYNKFPN